MSIFASGVIVLAAPAIPSTTPPFGAQILTLAGWVIFMVGVALVLAGAVGIGQLAWAHYQHRAGQSAMGLGIVLLCGVLLGGLGGIMNGLF